MRPVEDPPPAAVSPTAPGVPSPRPDEEEAGAEVEMAAESAMDAAADLLPGVGGDLLVPLLPPPAEPTGPEPLFLAFPAAAALLRARFELEVLDMSWIVISAFSSSSFPFSTKNSSLGGILFGIVRGRFTLWLTSSSTSRYCACRVNGFAQSTALHPPPPPPSPLADPSPHLPILSCCSTQVSRSILIMLVDAYRLGQGVQPGSGAFGIGMTARRHSSPCVPAPIQNSWGYHSRISRSHNARSRLVSRPILLAC